MPNSLVSSYRGHKDEVWFLEWSNDGSKLVSCGKDRSLIIWEFHSASYSMTLFHKFSNIHEGDVNSISISKDNRFIATASSDKSVKIWEIQRKSQQLEFKEHKDKVNAGVWGIRDESLFSCGIDSQLIHWRRDGSVIKSTKTNRCADLQISSSFSQLFLLSASSPEISILNPESLEVIFKIQEKEPILSFAISSNCLLLNTSLSKPELHVYELDSKKLISILEGHQQSNFMLKPSIGGLNSKLIACGSEDGKVLVWHHRSTHPLLVKEAHTLAVNCVAWHPKIQHFLVSASDDCCIKLWVNSNLVDSLNYHENEEIVCFDDESDLEMDGEIGGEDEHENGNNEDIGDIELEEEVDEEDEGSEEET